ncbi:MAG: amidase [Gemmatimonadetes bacterium]|nr:MAG: amidase [Gemmatimonadota bacterium]
MNSSGPGGGGAVCTPSATVACVTIQDFSFSPPSLSIKVGTTVHWTNNGPSGHTSTSDAGVWNSGNLSAPSGGGAYGGGTAAGSYQFVFTAPGTYGYHCSNHPPSLPQYAGFTGTITVTQ